MFQYAFYFHLHDKYKVQLSYFPVFFRRWLQQIFSYFSSPKIYKTKKIVHLEHDRLSDYLNKSQ